MGLALGVLFVAAQLGAVPCAPCVDTTPPEVVPRGAAASTGLLLGGAAAAFLSHEVGHVLANLAYGIRPDFIGITAAGFIPFFAISPDIGCNLNGCTTRTGDSFRGGRRGKYLISTAGFTVGHVASEIILSVEPCLRYRQAPFQTGWLAFNVALSAGYALASLTGWEVSNGDVRGSSEAANMDSRLFAGLLLAPALLDTYRYLFPDSVWAPWVSRGAKAAMLGLAFTF